MDYLPSALSQQLMGVGGWGTNMGAGWGMAPPQSAPLAAPAVPQMPSSMPGSMPAGGNYGMLSAAPPSTVLQQPMATYGSPPMAGAS